MTYLSSLPDDARLVDVFRAYPGPARPLLDLHEEVMRRPSPFTVAERELIAAYVSGLNECAYCHGVHTATAEAFGIPAGLLDRLLADVDTAPIDERLRPVLRYVGTLTRTPWKLTRADAEAVLAAGWSERALHDAALVCGLFNLMNRMVDGLGVRADDAYYGASASRLHQVGYAGLAALIEPGAETPRT